MTDDEKIANKITRYIDFLIQEFLNNNINRDYLIDQIFLLIFTMLDLKKVSGKTISEEEFLEAYYSDKDLNNKKLN